MAKRIINIKPGEVVEIRVQENSEDKDFYSVTEVAKMVGLNYYTIQRHIAENRLETIKIGRSHRISKESLTKYLNQ